MATHLQPRNTLWEVQEGLGCEDMEIHRYLLSNRMHCPGHSGLEQQISD